jgi:hypothetical protein
MLLPCPVAAAEEEEEEEEEEGEEERGVLKGTSPSPQDWTTSSLRPCSAVASSEPPLWTRRRERRMG